MIHLLRDQRGLSIIASIVTLLILSLLGYVFASLSAMTQQSSAGLIQSQQAFYAAEAGIEFALRQIRDGTPPPLPDGITLTLGSSGFTVISCTTEATCPPLPAGQRRVFSTGQAGEAKQRIEVIVVENMLLGGGFSNLDDLGNWPLIPEEVKCELGAQGAPKLEGEFVLDPNDFPPGGGDSSLRAETDQGGKKFRRCREQTFLPPIPANTPLRLSFDLKMTWEGAGSDVFASPPRFWVELQKGDEPGTELIWEGGKDGFPSPVPPSTADGEGWVHVGPIDIAPTQAADRIKLGFRIQMKAPETTQGMIKLDNLTLTSSDLIVQNSWQEPVLN